MMIKCDCGAEEIEFIYVEDEKVLEVSMWFMGHRECMSLKERLRWCWHILWHGSPWTDYIILNQQGVTELKEFLQKL